MGKKKEDGTYSPILISEKHGPTQATEKARIEKAGGKVLFGRVQGVLAVARAFGDIDYKLPNCMGSDDFVTAKPFLNKVEITDDVEFLIIACDGLWDTLSYDDAVQFVANSRNSGRPPQETVELLVHQSLEKGTMDNVTAIVVYIDHKP
eukprot:TRINITY_DN3581_c0_g1_i1.p1 TRINITY_DN3581_c0_g1~~TRINITY_DN3581_c0_g1_i1.p1  ORF type:complete len:149 (-),score=35.84 TRINITY_DN3581_c0_g1_i1:3-449(-)